MSVCSKSKFDEFMDLFIDAVIHIFHYCKKYSSIYPQNSLNSLRALYELILEKIVIPIAQG